MSFSWLVVAGGTSAVLIGACSNDVITGTNGATSSGSSASGSGSSAGAGGATTSSSSTTTSSASGDTSVVSSSGSSTSSGGGGAGGATSCDQVCAKIDACNSFVNCAQIEMYANIQFDCSSDQQVCLGNCIDPLIDCKNLFSLGGAVQGCMKMCGINMGGSSSSGGMSSSTSASGSSGASSSTSSTSSGNPQAACNGCVQGACMKQLQSCTFDFKSGCFKWVNCLQGCNDAACVAACDATNPAAAASHQDIITCACASCSAECPLTDPCGNNVSDGGVFAGDAGP